MNYDPGPKFVYLLTDEQISALGDAKPRRKVDEKDIRSFNMRDLVGYRNASAAS